MWDNTTPQDRPSGWNAQPAKPRVIANGHSTEVEPGSPFRKTISRLAAAAGFQETFYVKLSQGGAPAQFLDDPADAPDTLELGMVVEVSPHSVGA